MIGWYDLVSGGEGAIGYDEGGDSAACVASGIEQPGTGGSFQATVSSNRMYAISVSFGE